MTAMVALVRPLPALAGVLLAAMPALADGLCGRPQEAPEPLLERLAKTEKLAEIHRDKSYIALHDKARDITWTFTVAGHPAHPSAVCRRPVQDGGRWRVEMDVVCGAQEAECEKLVNAFEELNEGLLEKLNGQQQKK